MNDGVARTLLGNVIVTRNPCYHLGDIRVLKAVALSDNVNLVQINSNYQFWSQNLVDCIIFPTNGPRPHADEMSGGDLDGDKFFVCWDPEIVPFVKPYSPLVSTVSKSASPKWTLESTDLLRYNTERQNTDVVQSLFEEGYYFR
jgi:hypothetical protein